MKKLTNKAIPQAPRRILLLNPTKYLGNLLLAGGLIQDYAAHCRRHERQLLVVLDAAFRDLCANAFAGIEVLWYPRQALNRANAWSRLRMFGSFLAELRAFRPDLAFNLEEDSLASRLTQLSGARFRLGCSPARHDWGYEHVLPLHHGAGHRWYGYQAVFRALGMPDTAPPTYVKLHIDQKDAQLSAKLRELALNLDKPVIALHPAATKDYKKWPESAFSELCRLLINKGFTVALLGAGSDEWLRCERLRSAAPDSSIANLCNQLSLAELARFFRLCAGCVGNDSGPSHLASAQGLPGVVIFGPSEPAIWGPLGAGTRVLRKAELCDPGCSRRACLTGFRCLNEVRPDEVLTALLEQMQMEARP